MQAGQREPQWQDASSWNYANWAPIQPCCIFTSCTTISSRSESTLVGHPGTGDTGRGTEICGALGRALRGEGHRPLVAIKGALGEGTGHYGHWVGDSELLVEIGGGIGRGVAVTEDTERGTRLQGRGTEKSIEGRHRPLVSREEALEGAQATGHNSSGRGGGQGGKE